jgi:hypothetical protein
MPTDTKQLTADEVLDRLNAINSFTEDHPEQWRNQVSRDLNHLVGHARRWFEADVKTAGAVLRIVERVADFDSIKKKGPPNV